MTSGSADEALSGFGMARAMGMATTTAAISDRVRMAMGLLPLRNA